MISKLNYYFLLIVIGIIAFSCRKHDDPAIVPEVLDDLGPGWQRIKLEATLNLEDVFL